MQPAQNDKLPPHDMDAEMGALSCILQNPRESLFEVGHRLSREHFYDLKHKILWTVFQEKHSEMEPIDFITVIQSLKKSCEFDSLGGVTWLSKLQDFAPSPAHLPQYVDSLNEFYHRRRLLRDAKWITDASMGAVPLPEIVERSQQMAGFELGIGQDALNGEESGNRLIDDLERRHALNGNLSGLDTGFYKFNSLTQGLQFGEQTLIGARPSQGKTAIGLNIFEQAVFVDNVPSLFVSLEMSTEAIMRRLLSSRMRILMESVKRGSYSQEDFAKFSIFKKMCSNAPLHIKDGVGGMTIGEIEYHVNRHVKKFGTKLVVVDYLQKIRPSNKHEKRTYEVGEVSERLKGLAVQSGAAFLTLAQLNRESDKEKGKDGARAPRLSDLADSGQIERDADTVGLIHRDKADQTGQTKLIIAKQRDGELGVVPLKFVGAYCRFENATFETEESETRQNYND